MLRRRQGAEVDHHVQGEHLAAFVVGHLGVEPALDHHVQPDQRQAVKHAQAQPGPGVDQQQVEQGGDRAESGAEGERADMPNATNQRNRQPGAKEKTDEVPGHDQSEHPGGVAFGDATQGQ